MSSLIRCFFYLSMPNNKYILILLLVLPFISFSQIKTIQLRETDIPKSISYKGKIVNAVRYTDATADNIVISCQTDEYVVKDTEYEGTNIDLFAYSYTLKNGNWLLNWKVYDFEKDCPFDMNTKFIKDAFSVTDLNNDNIAEIWLMYTTGCRSDISEDVMKVIMYENGKKYAMRGENRVQAGNNEYFGGDYTFDTIFRQGPKQFRDYAAQLWKKHILGK